MSDPLYRGEAWLRNWSDSAKGGRRITLQLDEEGVNPFKGYDGERFAVVIVPLGNDDQPMEKEPPPPPTGRALGGLARAAALSPEQRSEIASKAAKKRWHELRPSARAAMLTKDAEFQQYIAEQFRCDVHEEAANFNLKKWCGVKSKADIVVGSLAADHLDNLTGNFRAWQQARGHGAAA